MPGKKSRRTRNKHSRRKNSRRQRGGMNPAGVNDKTMMSPSSQSLAQGAEYNKIHMGQHGGAFTPMSGAPVGDQGLLDSALRGVARIGPVDQAFASIQGMSDQSGGRRNKKKSSRRNKKKSSRRNKKKSSRRRQRGGSSHYRPADASAPPSLLPPSMESRAVGGMNPEWKLAENPTSFAPNLAK